MYIAADRPDKPVDTALSTCQQTFAVVRWSPAADNNAPITGFIVYYVTSHDSEAAASSGPHVGARVGATDVSARVKLAPWTEYWFSVAAVNDVGISERTEVIAAEPCETDPAPPARSPHRVCTNSQQPDQLVIVWEVRCCPVGSTMFHSISNWGGQSAPPKGLDRSTGPSAIPRKFPANTGH